MQTEHPEAQAGNVAELFLARNPMERASDKDDRNIRIRLVISHDDDGA